VGVQVVLIITLFGFNMNCLTIPISNQFRPYLQIHADIISRGITGIWSMLQAPYAEALRPEFQKWKYLLCKLRTRGSYLAEKSRPKQIQEDHVIWNQVKTVLNQVFAYATFSKENP